MQQINLLWSLPQQQNFWGSTVMFFLACIGLMVLLLLVLLGIEIESGFQSRHLAQLKFQKDQVFNAYQQSIKKYPLLVDSKSLPAKVSALAQSVNDQNKLWEKVSSAGLSLGFSNYMIALAQQIPVGVWLTSIYINNRNNVIALVGNSLKPVLIPHLMDDLSHAALFKDKVFKVLVLRETKNNGTVAFVIGTSTLLTEVPVIEKAMGDNIIPEAAPTAESEATHRQGNA